MCVCICSSSPCPQVMERLMASGGAQSSTGVNVARPGPGEKSSTCC